MNKLNEIAELAVKYVNTTDRHIFLTGKAGTGKTTFLKYITENTYKKAVVAAPTGVAAINAGGVTLHSLFQLPFGTFIPENIQLPSSDSPINTPQTLLRERKFNASKRQLIQELELLIIDEVSMLRADLLDCIDHTMRLIRRNRSEPFGGVQILFIGDLLQLPPVVRDSEMELLNRYYTSTYFFQAEALKMHPPIRVELQKIYRQSDQDFIDLLNRLRNNQQTKEDIIQLNQHYRNDTNEISSAGYIHLTTHNHKADKINQQRLAGIDGKVMTFEANIEGTFPENMFPVEHTLRLKKGAQVMFTKNDPSGKGRFFNGKIGQVSLIANDEIFVQFEDGEEVLVEKYLWENKRYALSKINGEIVEKSLGSFEQYPLKLAWAVTIHKCQGLTFDKAILDLSDTFAAGQLYVALSRLTTMKGLVLSSHISEDLPVIDATLREFVESFPDQDELTGNLKNDRREFIKRFAGRAFDFDPLLKELRFHEKSFNKDENRSLKQKSLPWTQGLIQDTLPWIETGHRFIHQVKKLTDEAVYLPSLNERMEKAQQYFIPLLEGLVSRIQAHRKEIGKEKNAKGYQQELEELEVLFQHHINQIRKITLFISEAAQNKVLTRQQLRSVSLYQVPVASKKAKKDKVPTAKISYDLLKEGKSIREIAESRGLVTGTIEGHLSKYIETGELDVFQFVTPEKVKKVLEKFEQGMMRGGEIKYELGDQFSFGEVRMALAHAQWMESQEK